ncbi:MAG: pilus assembly protein [Chloroflexi bacterium]|nr:pilus assembly protein [Chloroflexota bacterium]MBU1749516.1 pilus assembly protein [Chloroflexota bacterium]
MNQQVKREPGQSIVEFALILPVLLLLIFGFLDLGRAVYTQSVMANAAREGARVGIISTRSNADIRAAVRDRAIGVALTDGDITITPATRRTGDSITVHVTTEFYAVTPFAAAFMNGGSDHIDLESTATMTVE